MIFGIGVDIIETARIKTKLEKESGIREYLFSSDEIEYCEAMANRYEHFAARFAAKEALLKALGIGLSDAYNLKGAEIIHLPSGQPLFKFDSNWQKLITQKGELRIHVSISHLKDTACAMVVIEH